MFAHDTKVLCVHGSVQARKNERKEKARDVGIVQENNMLALHWKHGLNKKETREREREREETRDKRERRDKREERDKRGEKAQTYKK